MLLYLGNYAHRQDLALDLMSALKGLRAFSLLHKFERDANASKGRGITDAGPANGIHVDQQNPLMSGRHGYGRKKSSGKALSADN